MYCRPYFFISFKMSIRSIRFPLVYKIAITWLITPISQERLIFRPYDQDFQNRAKILHQIGPKNVHSHKIPTSLLKPYTVHITIRKGLTSECFFAVFFQSEVHKSEKNQNFHIYNGFDFPNNVNFRLKKSLNLG